jgi:hypothetical protein
MKAKTKPKKGIISSNRWPGIVTERDIYIKSCDKCPKQERTNGEVLLLQAHHHSVLNPIIEST